MKTTWDEVMGQALALIRELRAADNEDQASDLLVALTSGCSAPELALALQDEVLAMEEPLSAAVRDRRDTLLAGLGDVLGG
jgi:hypothetical protein